MSPRAVFGLVVPMFALAACAANGEVGVRASSDEASASASASAESEGKTEGTKSLGTGETTTAAAPAQGDPAAAPAACPLQCFVAQKGRVAPAEEQRLATDLAEPLSALRSCGSGNSLTIRFDSAGQLTEFGVDAERGQEGACVQAVRQKQPAVSFPGPSTLRCSERCGGDTTRAKRRR